MKTVRKHLVLISIAIMACLGVATLVYAASTAGIVYNANQSKPYTIITMATTTTGVSTGPGGVNATSISVPMSNFDCQVLYSGVTPTTSTVTIEGSIDGGTSWKSLSSGITTTLAAGNFAQVTGKWATQVRQNWSVLTKAAGSTTATTICIGQQ